MNCDDLNSKQKVEEKQEEKTEKAEKTEATDEKTGIPRFKKNNSQQKMNLGIRLNGFMMITACVVGEK